MFGLSIWELLVILAIVILVFGTRRLGNIGSDLGSAIKGFRKSMTDEQAKPAVEDDPKVIEGEASRAEAPGAKAESTERSES